MTRTEGSANEAPGELPTVAIRPRPQTKCARTAAGGISARSGGTLGTGVIVLEERDGGTVGDGAEEVCSSNFRIAIPHPTNLIVGRDGSAYTIVSADCPPE